MARIRITYHCYTCPRCQKHITTHDMGQIYVESPYHACKGCGAEIVVSSSQEYESLTKEERGFFWFTFCYGLFLVPVFLGGPAGLGLFFLLSFLRGLPDWLRFSAMALPPVALFAWMLWRGLSAVSRSQKRMKDPVYRERVKQLAASTPSRFPPPDPKFMEWFTRGMAIERRKVIALGLLILSASLPLTLVQFAQGDDDYGGITLVKLCMFAALVTATAGQFIIWRGRSLEFDYWSPWLIAAAALEVCAAFYVTFLWYVVPRMTLHFGAIAAAMWGSKEYCRTFQLNFRTNLLSLAGASFGLAAGLVYFGERAGEQADIVVKVFLVAQLLLLYPLLAMRRELLASAENLQQQLSEQAAQVTGNDQSR